MKKITFTFSNIRKIEEFSNCKIQSYFEIGTPSATFFFLDGNVNTKELKLLEGDEIFKDRQGRIFKKIN